MTETLPRIENVISKDPIVFHPYTVKRVTSVTPKMIRVTFAGEAIAQIASDGPHDDVRIQIPEDFSATPIAPTVTMDPFALNFPDDAPPSQLRAYTVRRLDRDAGELDVDFAIHGEGIATRWASQATPGQHVTMCRTKLSQQIIGPFDHHLLIGDATALPAIGRHIEETPAGTHVLAVIEIDDAAEEQQFVTAANLELIWVHRNGAEPGRNDLLVNAARALPKLDGYVCAFGAGESATVRQLRSIVVNELGIDKKLAHFGGYWKRPDDEAPYYRDGEDA